MANGRNLRTVIEVDPQEVQNNQNPLSEWGQRLLAASAVREMPEIDPFAPAAISYTSGTKGRPKGVVHGQHNLLLPGRLTLRRDRIAPLVPVSVCHQPS